MYKVRKRDGKLVKFDISKISDAMKKAFEAEDEKFDDDVIDFMALKVTADFSDKWLAWSRVRNPALTTNSTLHSPNSTLTTNHFKLLVLFTLTNNIDRAFLGFKICF